MNYYNENCPKAAAWLRELISAGEIPPGHIDTRSIKEVKASELTNYEQCHFFAGISGWPLAFRIAGIADDDNADSGSCPCGPFSGAGLGLAEADPRHLWPWMRDLVAERRAPVVFGEQVASSLGRKWLSGVRLDLERMGYAVGAADLCAASSGAEGEGWIVRGDSGQWENLVIGAPHIRQRLFWVAHSNGGESRYGGVQPGREYRQQPSDGCTCGLEHPEGDGREQRRSESGRRRAECGCGSGRMGDASSHNERRDSVPGQDRQGLEAGGPSSGSDSIGRVEYSALPSGARLGQQRQQLHRSSAWSKFDILLCRDGKARRVESGTFPLAHGISGRVGLLRGYGNAINPYIAAEFVAAYLDVTSTRGGVRV